MNFVNMIIFLLEHAPEFMILHRKSLSRIPAFIHNFFIYLISNVWSTKTKAEKSLTAKKLVMCGTKSGLPAP